MKILHDLNFIVPICIALFWAIIFIQSGLDKLINFKGNVDWLKGHFSKTFLRGQVKLLVATLAIFEMIAGGLSIIGLFTFIFSGTKFWIVQGVIFSMLSLLMLIFGQRLAQDYEGAKTIAVYFGIALLSALFLI